MRFALSSIVVLFLAFPVPVTAMPSIQAVQRQALSYAGLGDSAPRSWQKRAAWQAALPQLRVTVQRDQDEQLRLTNSDNISLSGGNVTIGPNELDLLQDFDSELRFQVSATWSLDRLIFNRDHILISQERRRRNEETWALLDRVNKIYFDYLEAHKTLASHHLPAGQQRLLARVLAESRAQLDALTGSWFSAQVNRDSSPQAVPGVSK